MTLWINFQQQLQLLQQLQIWVQLYVNVGVGEECCKCIWMLYFLKCLILHIYETNGQLYRRILFFLYLQALNHRFEATVMGIKLVNCYLQSSNRRFMSANIKMQNCFILLNHNILNDNQRWGQTNEVVLHCVMELIQWTCEQCPVRIFWIQIPYYFKLFIPKLCNCD